MLTVNKNTKGLWWDSNCGFLYECQSSTSLTQHCLATKRTHYVMRWLFTLALNVSRDVINHMKQIRRAYRAGPQSAMCPVEIYLEIKNAKMLEKERPMTKLK